MLSDCVFILGKVLLIFIWKAKKTMKDAVIYFAGINRDFYPCFSFFILFLSEVFRPGGYVLTLSLKD